MANAEKKLKTKKKLSKSHENKSGVVCEKELEMMISYKVQISFEQTIESKAN